jgi:hypothetical protein
MAPGGILCDRGAMVIYKILLPDEWAESTAVVDEALPRE